MKKLYYLLFFITGILNAQIIAIPDTNFKSRLIALGIDTNGDGNIQQAEALAVTVLDVSESSISSLQGIGNFTNLTSLNCYNNHYITNLDLSTLTNLTFLDCSRNSLTSLNVSTLTNLTWLACYSNAIYSLNVTPLVNLTHLDVSENNISVLDVANLTNLTYIGCASNNISVLAVDNLVNLVTLFCSRNNIATLNVGQLINLDKIQCDENEISSLNLALLPNLTMLRCHKNPITTLDVTALGNLEWFDVGSPQLLSLNVSPLANLEILSIYGGTFSNVNLNTLVNLRSLTVFNNSLTSIDISHSPLLWELRLFGTTTIQSLNLKNGGVLTTVNLSSTSNVYNVCCNQNDINLINLQLSFTNTALFCDINSNCLFFPYSDHNTITGNVIYDVDTNGCDPNDPFQQNIRMNISDGINQGANYTNLTGNYEFFTQAGNFTVTPNIENPAYFNFSPPNAIVNFSNNLNTTVNQNFCMSIAGTHNDLEVVLVPITTARPGFDALYKVIYKNKGNQTLSGDIEVTFPEDTMDYVSSSIAPNVQGLGALNWTYVNLNPFESRSFTVILNVNGPTETPPVNIDDILSLTAIINPVSGDDLPLDNNFSLRQIVVGSLDPNDKTCLEGNVVSPTKIGDYLHYNINFENIGTAAATFIIIRDAIDTTKFDSNSLQIMNSSHPMTTRITGNKVEFIFQNINLGAGQYGNVVFKIKTKSTLVTGNTVTNKADIYFDYNFPIATNLAATTFQALSNSDFESDTSIVVYPNPTMSVINVQSDTAIKSIQLYDVQGRLLQTSLENNTNAVIDISEKSTGVYFLKVTSDNGSSLQKIIKE